VALYDRDALKVRSLQSDHPKIVQTGGCLIERVNEYQTLLIAVSV
jgi:hypothetical protein